MDRIRPYLGDLLPVGILVLCGLVTLSIPNAMQVLAITWIVFVELRMRHVRTQRGLTRSSAAGVAVLFCTPSLVVGVVALIIR